MVASGGQFLAWIRLDGEPPAVVLLGSEGERG